MQWQLLGRRASYEAKIECIYQINEYVLTPTEIMTYEEEQKKTLTQKRKENQWEENVCEKKINRETVLPTIHE